MPEQQIVPYKHCPFQVYFSYARLHSLDLNHAARCTTAAHASRPGAVSLLRLLDANLRALDLRVHVWVVAAGRFRTLELHLPPCLREFVVSLAVVVDAKRVGVLKTNEGTQPSTFEARSHGFQAQTRYVYVS